VIFLQVLDGLDNADDRQDHEQPQPARVDGPGDQLPVDHQAKNENAKDDVESHDCLLGRCGARPPRRTAHRVPCGALLN